MVDHLLHPDHLPPPTHGDGDAQRTSLARAFMVPLPHHEDREESKHDGDDGGSSAGRHVRPPVTLSKALPTLARCR
jgi:hypothetical protein